MKVLIIILLYSILSFSKPILIASFNVLRLGEHDKDYVATSRIISKFDIVALQEVMNEDGLKKLKNEIENQTNDKWSYIISEKSVGSKEYKEYYGVIYKKNIVNKIERLGFYKDGFSKEFIREPYAVKILSNKFDFVLIISHSIFGNSKNERREEASRYHKVYKYFKNKSNEEDIILLGDFNLEATDKSFDYLKKEHNLKELLNPIIFKTTISDKRLANSYDNMFFNRKKLREYTRRYGMYDFTLNNYEEIRKNISDHLLIFAEFENGKDLDD